MVVRIRRTEVNKKIGDKSKAHFSEKQRQEALVLYKMTGNLTATARSLGIPVRTLFAWKASNWWKEAEADYLLEKRTLRLNRLEKLAELAADITQDRLENGDWKWNNETKQLERRPVPAIQASRILTDSLKSSLDQERRLDERIGMEASSKSQDRIATLMQEMINFAKSGDLRKTPPQVFDAELVHEGGGDPLSTEVVDDAVHDERETRLLEGEAPVRGQTSGTDEEAGGEQPSPSEDDGSRQGAGG